MDEDNLKTKQVAKETVKKALGYSQTPKLNMKSYRKYDCLIRYKLQLRIHNHIKYLRLSVSQNTPSLSQF